MFDRVYKVLLRGAHRKLMNHEAILQTTGIVHFRFKDPIKVKLKWPITMNRLSHKNSDFEFYFINKIKEIKNKNGLYL